MVRALGKFKVKQNQNNSTRYAVIAFLAMGVTAVCIISVFFQLYQVSKRNILSMWETRVAGTAADVGYYLTMPMDAVAFSAVTVNEMLAQGTSPEAVGRYLVNETAIYSSIINENSTGVYSYYRGVYLDGSGWTPPEDYEPTERPWYTAAVAADGKTTMVKPFLNLQTNTMMMSVSQLLNDKESVVSMDIFLDSVQEEIETISGERGIFSAFVIDNDGFVVAHSDREAVGKDCSGETGSVEHLVYRSAGEHREDGFRLNGVSGGYAVFVQRINDDWNLALVLAERSLFYSLSNIYISVAVALIVVLGAILEVFIHISRKHRESVRLSNEVMAIADIYTSVFQIDMHADRVTVIREDEELMSLLGDWDTGFAGRTVELANRISSDRSRELTIKFMSPDTLPERLSKVNSVSQELMDCKGRWIRLRFIVVDRDDDGAIRTLLWVFESIDEDRKQQEYLKKISETDLMTGVKNRGSGEALIRQRIAEGRKGMFCLLDADDFKSVNDIFGHKVGDEVIIMIANALKRTFEENGIVFRLGGDEFAAFAEDILEEEQAEAMIQSFFAILDDTKLAVLGERRITVSAGVTFYRDVDFDTFDDMYQRADEGTYESKRHSGNAITFV